MVFTIEHYTWEVKINMTFMKCYVKVFFFEKNEIAQTYNIGSAPLEVALPDVIQIP